MDTLEAAAVANHQKEAKANIAKEVVKVVVEVGMKVLPQFLVQHILSSATNDCHFKTKILELFFLIFANFIQVRIKISSIYN